MGQTFPLTILPGDPCFTASNVWASPVVQWGPSFTCKIPNLPAGQFSVEFVFQEPSVTAAGQRVFTISMGGQISPPIDVYAMGGTTPGVNVIYTGQVFHNWPGPMSIAFTASVRNAVVASMVITPTQGPPGPQGPPGVGGVITNGQQIQDLPCPAGYTGPRLADGNCLTFVLQLQPAGAASPPNYYAVVYVCNDVTACDPDAQSIIGLLSP